VSFVPDTGVWVPEKKQKLTELTGI
jgi:hypothetical protein